MKKILVGTILISIGFGLGILFENTEGKSKLDKHYLGNLIAVKSRLIYGSPVNSIKSLEDFEDKIELYMHLDGYNGAEILDMKSKAFIEASKEGKAR